jgi:hypothetical protein
MNKQMMKATLAYLEDWADDGHSIVQIDDLIGYGFSGPWLRDLAERHQSSKSDPKWVITVDDQPADSFEGVYTLDLLETLIAELGIGATELTAAARTVGCIPNPIGRGTSARLYTVAIRAALSKGES